MEDPSQAQARPRDGLEVAAGPVQSNGTVAVPVEEGPITQEELEIELKYGAEHVVKLFVPVTICLIFVVAVISSTPFYTKTSFYLLYTPFHETSDHWQDKLVDALLNAGIVLCGVVALTFALICLYRNRCYKIIWGWLGFSSLLLLSLFSMMFIVQILDNYNQGIDWITIGILTYNIAVVGLTSIHWKGPLLVQQTSLIYIAGLMSLVFIKYLPEYTLWVVLAVISIWDLVAVLTPKGPLKILVETAQERNEQIFPALIYSSGMVYSTIDGNEETSPTSHSDSEQAQASAGTDVVPATKKSQKKKNPLPPSGTDDAEGFGPLWENDAAARERRRAAAEAVVAHTQDNQQYRVRNPEPQYEEDDEDRGVKLGLGDFIFYSILVGKASYYGDWNTTVACFIGILIGLALTLVLLAFFKKALPALPISIGMGLAFYFITSTIVVPFTEKLTIEQVFI